MNKLTHEKIIEKIISGKLQEVLCQNLELKSVWKQDNGKDISAIANDYKSGGGWLIIGLDDQGKILGKSLDWLK